MKFLNRKTNIDFMSRRKIALVFSAILIVASIASLTTRGLNFGLDFTGGTLIEVGFPSAPDTMQVRENLANAGFDALVQTYGAATDIVVRIPPTEVEESSAELSTRVLAALSQNVEGEIEMRRVEFVGPQVGDELTEQGILAVIYAIVGVFLYVMFRFQWRFSVGAVAALFHDIIISMGVLSFVQIEFDLTVVAAILAVVG
jgi:preprotein translocase subunit SecF